MLWRSMQNLCTSKRLIPIFRTNLKAQFVADLQRIERSVRAVYMLLNGEGAALIIEGDDRDLSAFDDSSIDAIITDPP